MGRKSTKQKMEEIKNKLPPAAQGDKMNLSLRIERVSNGFIIKNLSPDSTQGTMVFNGQDGHRLATGYVLDLAIISMQEGEILDFNSTITFVKKI